MTGPDGHPSALHPFRPPSCRHPAPKSDGGRERNIGVELWRKRPDELDAPDPFGARFVLS
jgi:hypothetical protein